MFNEQILHCNLNIEESDLCKLEELDPFQSDGYQTHGRANIPIKIVYTDKKGKQTVDHQSLTLQILTRWLQPVPLKGNKNKTQSSLQSVKVCLFSQEDIFLSMISHISNSTFQALKIKNELNLHFKDLPDSLLLMFRNCRPELGEFKNRIELRLTYEGSGNLVVLQETQYKLIELIELYFSANNIEKAQQSIIYRYNYNKAKLSMLECSIDSIYRLLAIKNAPLLAYIRKTVGTHE